MADKNKSSKKKTKPNTIFKNIKHFFAKAFKNKDKNDKEQKQTNLEIVKGSRKKKLIIRIICYSIVLAVIIAVLVINSKTPTGLIEKIQNTYAAGGSGEFPVSVYAQNPDNMVGNGNVALILNKTYLEVYNQKGKLISAFSHGMFDPFVKCSEARFLVFDRNRYTLKIYNYSTELFEKTFDKNITCADISRDGSYAVATTSDTHNNAVYVFNKNNETVYTWNSANGYITDIAIANDGKSIAVSVVDAKMGSFVSSVYILRFDSAHPYYKAEFDSLITSLNSVNSHYFLASGVDFASVIEWEGSNRKLDITGVLRFYDSNLLGYSALVFGREDNEHSNSIFIVGEDGSVVSNFEFNSTVGDICVNRDYVLLLSENTVYIYDHDGNVLNEYLSDTKPNFAYLTDDGNAIVLDNSQLKLLPSSK